MGAGRASGELLAFVDADTELAPGALAVLAGEVEGQGGGLVSLLTRYRMASRGERALMPAFALFQLCFLPIALLNLTRARASWAAFAYGPAVVVEASAYLQLAGGVWYAEGGMHSVVEALARPLHREATVLTGVEVTAILQHAGRVRGVWLVDGAVIPAEVVVSNADVQVTRRLAGLRGWRQRMTMSCSLLHLGTSRPFPSLHHHSLLVGPG